LLLPNARRDYQRHSANRAARERERAAARRLDELAAAISGTRAALSDHLAARVRVAAVVLSDREGTTYLQYAATATLLQQRAAGQAPIGESIVLALE
jgi:hypothetical protein